MWWHMLSGIFPSAVKKDQVLSCAGKRVQLKTAVVQERSQSEKGRLGVCAPSSALLGFIDLHKIPYVSVQ